MESYRRCNVFERALSLSASPSLPENCSEKIVELFYRCTFVGGSTTLITRCGLLSWIQARLAVETAQQEMLKALASRIYDTCDVDRVSEWSGGALARPVGTLIL